MLLPKLLLPLTLFAALLSSPQAWTAAEKGLYFYRSPQSLFSSGQMSRGDLEKSKVRTASDQSYLIERDHHHYWVPAEQILRDVNLSKSLTADGLPVMQDMGLGVNLLASSLRKQPEWTSDIVCQLPALSKFDVISIEGSWALVEWKKDSEILRGYTDLNNLVVKADFASFALTPKNQWRPVQYRDLDHLILDQGERIPLEKIQSMITRPERGIVAKKNDKMNLSLRGHVTIHRSESGEWNVSELKGHGEVYWKYEIPEAWQKTEERSAITTDQLLKREITSVAFHPQNPKWGAVSSQGLFLTTDGETWVPVKSFAGKENPVAISEKGEIVAGSMISRDSGKTFEAYLRWEQIARLLEDKSLRESHSLHLREASFKEDGKLKLVVDTGIKSLAVLGNPNDGKSWKKAE